MQSVSWSSRTVTPPLGHHSLTVVMTMVIMMVVMVMTVVVMVMTVVVMLRLVMVMTILAMRNKLWKWMMMIRILQYCYINDVAQCEDPLRQHSLSVVVTMVMRTFRRRTDGPNWTGSLSW